MFYLQRNRITVDQSRLGGIVLECSIQNRRQRNATLIAQEYELWLLKDAQGQRTEFLSRLSFDLTSGSTDVPSFTPQSFYALKLIWHFTPNQLQQIEDSRQGGEPHLELRSRLLAHVRYFTGDGKPHGDPHYVEESAYDFETDGYPIRFKMDHTNWAELLDRIGFRHIILQELSIPTFPPAFGRAENHVREAWNHHRAGRRDAALMSCYKAFECLGFNIAGAEIPRAAVLTHLMNGQVESKRKSVEALWDGVTRFCHLGRHERGGPVPLTYLDGELAVVSTTLLLKYLAAP